MSIFNPLNVAIGVWLCVMSTQSIAEDLHFEHVTTMRSIPDETYLGFVLRVSTFISKWTDEHDVEVCGIIGIDQSTMVYTVDLTTDHSQLFCILNHMPLDDSYMRTDSIYSHPHFDCESKITLREETFDAFKAIGTDLSRIRPSYYTYRGFSAQDYAGGSGWLIDNGVLMYQRGIGTSVRVASFIDHTKQLCKRKLVPST